MKMPVIIAARLAASGTSPWLLWTMAVCMAVGAVSLASALGERTPVSVENSGAGSGAPPPADSIEPIQPIAAPTGLNAEKVALGEKLFDDRRLSHNDTVSCSSCHDLATGGTDRRARSIGIYGAAGVINAPTVFNVGFNFSQFWDGRAETLEAQVDGPVESNVEMGSSWPEVIGKLREIPEYSRAFRRIYSDGIQSGNVRDSIAEFERSLATPNSRFDQYLRHEPNVFSDGERQGYILFSSLGCASCHQGANVGGNMYQKLGIMAPYFLDRGNLTRADRGRFNVTGDPQDMYMFKVPSLRNVALTAPYFHDGSAATLTAAVGAMAKYQLGRPLTGEETELIVAFLYTLTGEWNGHPL
jgi:cytochrome c peroxidase